MTTLSRRADKVVKAQASFGDDAVARCQKDCYNKTGNPKVSLIKLTFILERNIYERISSITSISCTEFFKCLKDGKGGRGRGSADFPASHVVKTWRMIKYGTVTHSLGIRKVSLMVYYSFLSV